MKTSAKIILTIVFCSIVCSSAQAKTGIKESIVKIYTVCNRYNYYEPWQMRGQRRGTGSGCIISGNRILTNAHVIADQTFVQVKRAGQSKKYTAEVEIVAHECDLAILKVKDDSFFTGVSPLQIGKLAEVRDKIAVFGFPVGGDELCITEGVVSRVEHCAYTHSKAYLLSCQIDAPINPGNSGGPVVKDNKIIGIAFQAGGGENIGYMVPAPLINHFLQDIKDNKYDGIPDIGISYQKMENSDLRLKYNMSSNQTGLLLNKIYPGSSAGGILKSGDVILSVDDKNIANDGTIEFRENERTLFLYVIQNKYINDFIKFKILRNNKIVNAKIKLTNSVNFWRLVPHEQYDIVPTYYIIGGLVFEPLTLDFLNEWGGDWNNDALKNLINYYYHGEISPERKEIVILVQVLADEINTGYHDWKYNVISYVNGQKISTIKDLVRAFEDYKGEYHTIVDERGYKIVLNKNKVDQNNKKILEKYKINFDRSEDLKIKSKYSDITSQELMQKVERKEKFVLLDVRTKEEYIQGHIKGSIFIPHTNIKTEYKKLGCKCHEIIVYCQIGEKSRLAGESLAKLGFGKVINLLGGITSWEKVSGELISVKK